MNLKQMIRYVLDKLNVEEGDRRIESLITSAINDAYVEISKLDCTIEEEVYYSPFFRSLELPDDFLVDLNVSHSKRGKLNETQYKISGQNMIITSDLVGIPGSDTITLIYGTYPTLLSEDTDEPRLRKEYHRTLCYYALYEITEEDKYMELYVSELNAIPPFEPFLDEGLEDETVIDMYPRW